MDPKSMSEARLREEIHLKEQQLSQMKEQMRKARMRRCTRVPEAEIELLRQELKSRLQYARPEYTDWSPPNMEPADRTRSKS